MSKSYEQKAQEVERQLAEVDASLAKTPGHAGLLATRASLLRSLRWYRTRSPRSVSALGVGVSDVIASGDVSA